VHGGVFDVSENPQFTLVVGALLRERGVAPFAAFLVVQVTVGIPDLGVKDPDQLLSNQTTFVLIAIAFIQQASQTIGQIDIAANSVARAVMRQAPRDCQWFMIAPPAFTTIV